MCGICCLLDTEEEDEYRSLKNCMTDGRIRNRGPDATDSTQVQVPGKCCLTFVGHVLQLRGHLTKQPLQHTNGDLILWNGEVFDGIQVEDKENDTEVLLNKLSEKQSTSHILETMATVQGPWSFIYWQKATQTLYFGRDMFGRRSLLWHLPTDKEKAFILSSVKLDHYDFVEVPSVGLFSVSVEEGSVTMMMYPRTEAVWPGTSVIVETSDLEHYGIHQSKNFSIEIDREQTVPMSIPKLNREIFHPICEKNTNSSSSLESGKAELSPKETKSDKETPLKPRDNEHKRTMLCCGEIKMLEEKYVPQQYLESVIQSDPTMDRLSNQLIDVLLKAVTLRVYNQVDLPRRSKPCDHCKGRQLSNDKNGGLSKDTDDRLNDQNEVNDNCTGIDFSSCRKLDSELIPKADSSGSKSNVVLENCSASTKNGLSAKTKVSGMRETSESDSTCTCCNTLSETFERSNEDSSSNKRINGDSVISGTPKLEESPTSRIARSDGTINGHSVISGTSKVAILFSGGIDSAVITALVDRCLAPDESVDLLNVAFEQRSKVTPRKKGDKKPNLVTEEKNWNVPDRITGYTALQELNPNRKWNFIEVNVTKDELQDVRSKTIQHLVYPLESVLDDSIGCAVWFAARGCGVLGNTDQRGRHYQSSAKVILCGMGADEQLAGYSRHRGKFMEQGWQGLLDEIEMEVNRISSRNLGRDDRIITDHGKESRFPFLDENVVQFLQGLPIQYKADLSLPRGIGEKLLLRLSAIKLGLVKTATFPKRAIQFGSRIAKTENSKEKGSDKCHRLKQT